MGPAPSREAEDFDLINAGIKAVVFDRGARQYHGRVEAVADGAREAGLQF